MTMDFDKDGFVVAMMKLMTGQAFMDMDIDGAMIEELFVKYGLATEGPATEADCKEDWAKEWDIEPGDQMLTYHPDLVALMKRREG